MTSLISFPTTLSNTKKERGKPMRANQNRCRNGNPKPVDKEASGGGARSGDSSSGYGLRGSKNSLCYEGEKVLASRGPHIYLAKYKCLSDIGGKPRF